MTVRGVRSSTVVLAAAVAAGCGDGSAGGPGGVPAVFTDSAGVAIVANRIPERGLPVLAVLSDAPTLTLEGPGEAFQDVTGAVTLSGGGVAVSDGASQRVVFFDASGRPLTGDGSGEPVALTDASTLGWVGGDTVWVADQGAGIVVEATVNGAERTASGTAARGIVPEGFFVLGRFEDGSYLLTRQWTVEASPRGVEEGVRRDTASWARWVPGERGAVGVGRFLHDEIMVVETERGAVAGVPPFGRRTTGAVSGQGFWVGEQETFELRRYGMGGTLERIARLEGVDLTLTEALKASVRPAPSPDGPSLVDRFWEGAPATVPAYTRLLVDDADRLWVGEHVAGEAPPMNWIVFSERGQALGMVTLHPGLRLLAVGSDHVLGVETTEAGQRVVRYRLRPE